MIEWGISANSHNAALAVFDNKSLVFASETERFSKIKNDANLTRSAIKYALQYGAPEQIHWYEKPILKTLRQLIAGQRYLIRQNDIRNYLSKFKINNIPINTVKHHLSHAAAGFYTSKFQKACVVVIDAIGEFETLTIWCAEGRHLKKRFSLSYPNSIGLWYSAMTQRCGLKPNEEEYILMGMSALGDSNRYYNQIQKDFIDTYNLRVKVNLHKGCLQWRPDLTSQQDIYDIAAATQRIYEQTFIRVLQIASKLIDTDNLVLMGGCALNCVANSFAYNYFNNVWIMPAPGDSGSAIGAVLASKKEHIEWPGPFLGYDLGYKSTNNQIVDYLLINQICGVARGRAEFGPRALGNRSLIADPRGDHIKEKVNSIKHREQFRPFAPMILEEEAYKYFTIPKHQTSRYMQFVYKCRHPDRYPAIVHYDNSSRVQTVPKDKSPARELLEIWYNRTGCPMLLNTSLNIKREPILNDENDIKRWQEKYNVKIFT